MTKKSKIKKKNPIKLFANDYYFCYHSIDAGMICNNNVSFELSIPVPNQVMENDIRIGNRRKKGDVRMCVKC